MLSPEDFNALLNRVASAIAAGTQEAMAALVADIKAGIVPETAVREALRSFEGEYYATLANAYSQALGTTFGIQQIRALPVSGVMLSTRLYAHSRTVSAETLSVIRRHTRGMSDARKLAMDLYEGYGFREKEVLKLSPNNPKLPLYLRQALTDEGLKGELSRLIAKGQVSGLKTSALRAGYAEALDAVISGAGQKRLEKRLNVAFQERMRYFANRIAQTELARAHEDDKARELMGDESVEYVKFSMSQRHPKLDICDLFARMDKYGLGQGIYPKDKAPKPPLHPFCLCALSPKRGLSGEPSTERENAERDFLRVMGEREGSRIAGSLARYQQVTKGGKDLRGLINQGKDPMYRIQTVGEAVGGHDFSSGDGKIGRMMNDQPFPQPALNKKDGDARAYVIGNGKRSGHEFIFAYDAESGKTIAMHTSGLPDGVDMPDSMRDAAMDRTRKIVVHHNHPNGAPPGAGDLSSIGKFPGIASAAINGHDGSYYRITPLERGNIEKSITATVGTLRRVASDALFARLDGAEFKWIAMASRVDAMAKAGVVAIDTNVDFNLSNFHPQIEMLSNLLYIDILRSKEK